MPHSFQAGQLVSIRPLEAIRATLDENGEFDGLPFMPEMARFAGRQAIVHRRADYTCVEGHGLRQLRAAVFLMELRCDGAAHDGCQRNCMLIWKEAWLEVLRPEQPAAPALWPLMLPTWRDGRYRCQSTRLLQATTPLSRWNLAPWLRAVRNGELSIGRLLRIVGATLRLRLRGGRDPGTLLGTNSKPAKGQLKLRPGERVRIKDACAVRAELDAGGKNRGLAFVPSMHPHLGREYEVAFPLERMIHEQTGRMIPITHTVVLKGVNCGGTCVKECPRASNLYWRESWLERVVPAAQPAPAEPVQHSCD